MINGRLVTGALSDLAVYAKNAIGKTFTVRMRDSRVFTYRIVAGREYNKEQLAGSASLRKTLYDQSNAYGPPQQPVGSAATGFLRWCVRRVHRRVRGQRLPLRTAGELNPEIEPRPSPVGGAGVDRFANTVIRAAPADDEPRRGLVRHHRTPGHPPRHLRLGQRPQRKIRAFIDGWNDRGHPFVWTKTADQILTKAKRPTTINSGH